MIEEIKNSNLIEHLVDWRVIITYQTSIPVTLIKHTTVRGDIAWELPASLIRGKFRRSLLQIMTTLAEEQTTPDGSEPHLELGHEVCKKDPDHLCLLCRTFGSPFAASKLVVERAILAPDQVIVTTLRSRGVVTCRQGLPLKTDAIVEVTQPNLKFLGRVRGAIRLKDWELQVVRRSITMIHQLGWGGGYGLSLCSIDLPDYEATGSGGTVQ